MKLTKCDVCGDTCERETPTLDFDPPAREVGGRMYYSDGTRFEWPLKEEYIDLCPKCCEVAAEALRERMEGR